MPNISPKWTKLLAGAAKFMPEAPWVAIVVELVSQLATHMGVASGDSKESLHRIEALRGDLSASLSQITAAHSSLAKQLALQGEAFALHSSDVDAKLDALNSELSQAKLAAAFAEHRFVALEAAQRRAGVLLTTLCLGVAITIVLLVIVLLHQH